MPSDLRLVDTHCHLDFPELSIELTAVLQRARTEGVAAMICIGAGSDCTSARNAVTLAASTPDVWAAVGVHPHDSAHMTEANWTELDGLARAPRVVAIGETGLDYHYDHSPRPAQQEAYRRFVALARAVGRPVVSHIRDAHEDARMILREEGADEVGGVVHCFTGTVEDARAYLDFGHYLSFSGILTFKNAEEVRRAAAFAPADRILVETDAPLLAPVPFRGRPNEPAFITKTVETLARVRNQSVEAVAEETRANACRLFGVQA